MKIREFIAQKDLYRSYYHLRFRSFVRNNGLLISFLFLVMTLGSLFCLAFVLEKISFTWYPVAFVPRDDSNTSIFDGCKSGTIELFGNRSLALAYACNRTFK
jgi:hypothetical protein